MFAHFVLLSSLLLASLAFVDRRRRQLLRGVEIQKELSAHLEGGRYRLAFRLIRRLGRTVRKASPLCALYIELLRHTGQIEKAVKVARKAVKSDEILIWKEYGKALLASGDAANALAAFEHCESAMQQPNDRYELAQAHLLTGSYEAVLAICRPYLMDDDADQWLIASGDALSALERYEEALRLFDRIDSSDPMILERKATCLLKTGETTRARRIFASLHEETPTDLRTALNLGLCLEREERFDQALAIYQSDAIWHLRNGELLLRCGICCVRAERYSFAARYLQEAHSKGIESAPLLSYLAFSHFAMREFAHAKRVYLELMQRYPANRSGYLGFAQLAGSGFVSVQQALNAVYKAIEICPDSVSWEAAAYCEDLAGHGDKATQIREIYLAHARNNQETK